LISCEIEIGEAIVIKVGGSNSGSVVEIDIVKDVEFWCGNNGILKGDSCFGRRFGFKKGCFWFFFSA